jgi:small-conductance mechanosensitive channel
LKIVDILDHLLPTQITAIRILFIFIFALGSHLGVLLVRLLSRFISTHLHGKAHPKWMTITSLGSSIMIFGLYFGALGMILRELGVSLTAYLASASVVGLAVGFGSQGLVQDVVMGLTLVFSDLIDVGEMVEIVGQTGIVRSIGMRFVVLENAFGAIVFIPNRTVSNVINYPKGYIRCIVDVLLSGNNETKNAVEKTVQEMMISAAEQYPGIQMAPPSIEGKIRTSTGKEIIRVKFRIWPGRGTSIETTFKQELLKYLRDIDVSYADWMINVEYEVEKLAKSR